LPVNRYRGKAATTEDFKAAVYKSDASFETAPDGTVVLNLGVAQSGVDDKFRLVIPVDLELDDGKIAFVRRARMVGNTSPSRAGAAQKDKEQAAARGHQLL
jgi:hypothetical protein